VDLQGLKPASLPNAKGEHRGRCSACEKPLKRHDEVVHLYGEAFHFECAFYRPIGQRRTA
jgi:hypothetical protein